MTVTPSRMGQALLKTTPTTVYTVPAGVVSATIRSITAPNNTAAQRALTVWLVPPGGSATDATAIANQLAVPARGLAQDDAVHVLPSGGKVVGKSDADDAFTLTVDGAENT